MDWVDDLAQFISITEFAAKVGISRQRVHQLIKAKRIRAERLGHSLFIRKLVAKRWGSKRLAQGPILKKFKVS